ncbi:ATP-dependent RNA helicase DHX8, partial [Exaiptasia diaphana]
MDELQQLEQISLVSKVCTELDNHLGIDDKVLAEFIIMLGEKSADVNEFKENLAKNGAEFPDSFAANLLRLIEKMRPKQIKAEPGSSKVENNDDFPTNPEVQKRKKLFPGLSLPDKEIKEEKEKISKEDEEIASAAFDELEALLPKASTSQS